MSYSSGVFSLVAGNPVVTGTTVSSTWANNTLTDIATGLSTCMLKDGTQTATVNVDFAKGISVATSKFTVDPATGNIVVAGTLLGNAAMLSPVTNVLAALVNLNNTANFFDGPSVAQGTSGTWLVFGIVTLYDTGAGAEMIVKLWDGTTTIATTDINTSGVGKATSVTLFGFITSPAGNIRMSVKDATATTGVIAASNSGLGKDSVVTAIRIG